MTFRYIGWTPFAGKATAREATIDGVIIHHAATISLDTVKRMFASTVYEVSANAIGTPDGIISAVPEHLRAWTSGSKYDGGAGARFDHRRVTIEIVNSTGAPSWQIAEATYRHVAEWIAYLADKYDFPINRDTVIGHGELWTRYRASYQTACPGGVSLDRLVTLAKAHQVTDTFQIGASEMPYILRDPEGYWLISSAGRSFIHKSGTSPQVKQARAALAAWKKAADAGKTEFSLGKYNGRQLRGLLAKIGK